MFKNKELRTKTYKLKTERGVSLYLAFMLMSLLLGIALGISGLLIGQFESLRGIGYSAFALEAADAGIENALYIDQIQCAALQGQDRVTCLEASLPLGLVSLSNGATYQLTLSAGGVENCPVGSVYCIKSVGTFQSDVRAIRVAR